MTKTRARVYGTADNIRPYIERAMKDEQLRAEVLRAFSTARDIYSDLMGDRDKPVKLASRVATDDEIRDKLRDTIEDLRRASDRLQGKQEHGARNTGLLVAGIALGILFNPVTGPETRRFLRDLIGSGSGDSGGGTSPNGRG
jgi:hypothetical protein